MGLFDPFRRKPGAGTRLPVSEGPAGDSPDNWQAGDIAECLHRGPWFMGGLEPRLGPSFGDVHKVVGVKRVFDPISEQPVQFLIFSTWLPKIYVARVFRKVTPRADRAEAADAAFIESLRRAPETVR